MSADGTTALVGVNFSDTDDGEDVGEAYVFRRTEMGWNTENPVMLLNPGPDKNDQFGSAVALSADGSIAFIGAYADSSYVGKAYLFERTEMGWDTENPVTFPNPEPDLGGEFDSGGAFGYSVALSSDGNIALVGAFADHSNAGSSEGQAYAFRRTETSLSQEHDYRESLLPYLVNSVEELSDKLLSPIPTILGMKPQGIPPRRNCNPSH